MRWLVALIGVSTLVLVLWARDYPKKIQEFPEPWQVLEPGTPRPRFPVPRMISEGSGAAIAPGDLVQLHIRSRSQIPGRIWNDWGNWWTWVGFRKQEETSFFANEPRVASALVGLREGSVLEFVEANDEPGIDSRYAGTLNLNVFGDSRFYDWRKYVAEGSVNIYVSTASTPSVIEVKRVCKGQAKFRTVRLFDDGPVKVCPGLSCYTSHEPREAWIDEARMEAVCQDGRKVTFEYGPTGSRSGRSGRSPVQGYFDEWLRNAWDKLPKGVQFEGNRPPVAPPPSEPSRFTGLTNTRTKIELLARVKDPDGDRVTARIIKFPDHGQLSANPDGTFTYTPSPGWNGRDEVSYKASDGLVESELALAQVYVSPEKK